jgi:hypothetical protein
MNPHLYLFISALVIRSGSFSTPEMKLIQTYKSRLSTLLQLPCFSNKHHKVFILVVCAVAVY